MEYHPSYFEDEVRDGFFVPSIIKMCWVSAKQNYDDLHQFCEKRGISFAGAYGTLMGAVRHGGFIPWDDDMDTLIFREEFERLYQCSKKKEEFENRILYDYMMDGVPTKMVRAFSNFEETDENRKKKGGFPVGDAMDLFIYDGIPAGSDRFEAYKEMLEKFAAIVNLGGTYDDKTREECVRDIESKRGVNFSFDSTFTIQVFKAIEDFCAEYSVDQCSACAMIWDWYMRGCQNQLFDSRMFEDFIEVPFETGMIRIPVGYDHILRKIYGNYMQTVIAKSGHDYPFFNHLEQKMLEENYNVFLRFQYSREWLKNVRKQMTGKKSLKEAMLSLADLLTEAHEFIQSNFEKQEYTPSVLDVLGQCQELVIGMGEEIEKRAQRPEHVISVLEQYCDLVYSLYQVKSDMTGINLKESKEISLVQLSCYDERIRECIGQLKDIKEIVFLVYHVKYWKAYHTLWERMNQEEFVNTVVISVPYYYKNYNGEPVGEMQLETDGFPSGVTITSYKEYNFEERHPDVVYYQFPYDEFSYALTLVPYFYTYNIRKYTEKMIFVPPFLTYEIADDDERSRYTLKWLLATPGAVLADEILVQSEQVKKVYRELLEGITGKDEELNWNDKIVADNFPLTEWEKRKQFLFQDENTEKYFSNKGIIMEKTVYDEVVRVPADWLHKKFLVSERAKKVILYYVSGSILYEYRQRAVEKIREVLELAEKCKDEIIFLWYLDPYAKIILEKREPDVWAEYQGLVDWFREKEFGILDNSGDKSRAARFCDAFYGDGGVVMHECKRMEKPILWENPDVTVA